MSYITREDVRSYEELLNCTDAELDLWITKSQGVLSSIALEFEVELPEDINNFVLTLEVQETLIWWILSRMLIKYSGSMSVGERGGAEWYNPCEWDSEPPTACTKVNGTAEACYMRKCRPSAG